MPIPPVTFTTTILTFTRERIVLLGIFLAAVYWLVESFVHSQIFYNERPGFIHQVLLPDAHETWMRLVITTLFIAFAFYAQWGINRLKGAERAVRRANMQLTQIFDTAADGMRVVDRELTILKVNTTFLKMVGLRKDQVVGKKCYDVFRGDICHSDRCPMVRVLAGESRIEYDENKLCVDGSVVPCIVTATPFKDEFDNLIGMVEDFKDISDRKKAEEHLRQSHVQLRDLGLHMENIREEERKKMAREIHDELGQSLTVFKMDIHWLATHLHENSQCISEKLDSISHRIDETVHTVQRLSSELRPGMLDDLGLSAAIEWQANEIRDRTDIVFIVSSCPEDIVIDPTASITIFRVFQEALTNIIRHSHASIVEITLTQGQSQTTLVVHDNGQGITRKQSSSPTSLGLIGMRERIHNIDGQFSLKGKRGQGTTVEVSIPSSPLQGLNHV